MPITGLYIATPAFQGFIKQKYQSALTKTAQEMMARGREVAHGMFSGESMLQVARNVLLAQFMARPRFSHILFVDADIEWTPEGVLRLTSYADEVDAICGVYQKKTMPPAYACNFYNPMRRKGQLLALKDAPTGFLLLSRKCIKRMMEAYPEQKCILRSDAPEAEKPFEYALFDGMIDPVSRVYLREDFGFTRRWQALGEEIWCDPNIWLSHSGMYNYAGVLADYLKEHNV